MIRPHCYLDALKLNNGQLGVTTRWAHLHDVAPYDFALLASRSVAQKPHLQTYLGIWMRDRSTG